MKYRILSIIILCVCAATVAAQEIEVVEPESVGVSSAYLENIDALAAKHLNDKMYAGVSVLMARHGDVVYNKAFGDIKPDTIIRWASMTKPVTGVAVMQLNDRGLINLSDPLSKYIPGFADMNVAEADENGEVAMVPAKREITVHDCLTMTSGLGNTWVNLFGGAVNEFIAQTYMDAGVAALFGPYDTTLEEQANLFARLPLISQPGEGWLYANPNLIVLARVVEIVSGMTFDEYLRQHIFEPLGMSETWFYVPPEAHDRLTRSIAVIRICGL